MDHVRLGAKILVCIFAAIGFFLLAGFFAVRWHLTDVKGSIDLNDRNFADQNGSVQNSTSTTVFPETALWCKILAMDNESPEDAHNIIFAYRKNNTESLIAQMIADVAVRAGSSSPLFASFTACDEKWTEGDSIGIASSSASGTSVYAWEDTPEWGTLSGAIAKDASTINHVAQETGVAPRMIVAQLIGEQMRLYNSERTLYETAFAPLKILGSETQFSMGVTGVKAETAQAVEENLTNSSSEYYPGSTYEHLLDFTTADHDTERVERISDSHNHYYAYLYTALFIKEVEAQWARAGYDISQRPEVISTLYNIGFSGSHPNADPHVGGASITIAGQDYTFGSLGYEFYYSGAMANLFSYWAR